MRDMLIARPLHAFVELNPPQLYFPLYHAFASLEYLLLVGR